MNLHIDLSKCPQCHAHFSKEVVSKEVVNRETVTFSANNTMSSLGNNMTPSAGGGFDLARQTITKEVVRYKYTYKCKHCGYEWSEVKTEDA